MLPGPTAMALGAGQREGPQDEWDAAGFLKVFAQAKLSKDYARLKKLLAEVAESNYKLRSRWRVPRTIPVTYQECSEYRSQGGRFCDISFSTLSTVDALLHFAKGGKRAVCGLNFANGKDVGGGYKRGAAAQEEDLCRRIPALFTSLYRASKDGLYPFGPSTCAAAADPQKYSDVLYTQDLLVARRGEEEGFALLPEREQALVSLVAAAAPNVRFAQDLSDPDLMYRTIVSVFKAPRIAQPEVSVLVLGAWGCGAFGGDPVAVAQLFVRALVQENLGQHYEEVHLAIPRTSPTDSNYENFRAVFEQSGVEVRDL